MVEGARYAELFLRLSHTGKVLILIFYAYSFQVFQRSLLCSCMTYHMCVMSVTFSSYILS